jgi:insecticidal toxin complex protein TccC
MPVENWREWINRMALSAVNSPLGLAVLPTGTSSPASPIIVTAMATNIALIAVQLTQPNPAWSMPITWPEAENGELPPYEVTQAVNLAYATKVLVANTVAQVIGPPLALIVGGYVDQFRGTKEKAEKKAEASALMINLDATILQQQMFPSGVVPENAQTTLINQVLKLESLTGISSRTVNMLESIRALGPHYGMSETDPLSEATPTLSRRSSNASRSQSRIPVPVSRSSSTTSSASFRSAGSNSSSLRSVVTHR